MKVNVLGAGPGGLYACMLLKKTHPDWEITVLERNPRGATYGWGVVFSDRTLTALREADVKSYSEITESFVIWDAIDIYYKDELVRCGGHVFAGIARPLLLNILTERCEEMGIRVQYENEVHEIEELAEADLMIAADGINSKTRDLYADQFKTRTDEGVARFIWFGTDKVFDSFTFIFRESEHGLFQVHAYPFDGTTSTFIVECREETWRRAGLDEASEEESVAYCERLFSDHLQGHRLLSNYSRWFTFQTVRNKSWHHGNIVLLGDSAHTAHFSIGSGTKLAMEDAIALATAFEQHEDLEGALNEYEMARRPKVEALQSAADESQRYFENVQRYLHFEPLQFAFHLLTRSGRITYDNLKQRDPYFTNDVERWFAQTKSRSNSQRGALLLAPPMMFAPLQLREMALPNRVVMMPTSSYSAEEGQPGRRHEEQLVRRAAGGAGLVITEPVAVSETGRITPGDSGLYRQTHRVAWQQIVERVHEYRGTNIGVTLSHAGRRGSTRPRTFGVDQPLRRGSWSLLSASAIPFSPMNQVPRAMERSDMDEVRDAYVQAAEMAVEAGFDLLQLHMAHGYLLASFLSPLANQREDAYGGSLENRMRYPLEIFDAVRSIWPQERPLAVVLPASDWAKDGLELVDAVTIACRLKERGCDLVTVMAGQTVARTRPNYDPSAFAQYSDVIRNEAHMPTLSTGYLTTSDQINTLLAGGRADLCLFDPPGLEG